MGTAAVIAGVAGAFSVGSAVHQREEAKSAERQVKRDQTKANNIQKASAGAQRATARRRAIAASRVQQARNRAQASEFGISGSSSVEGANAAATSTLNSSFASNNRAQVSGQATFDARQDASNAAAAGQRRAGTAAAVGGLFSTGAGISANFI
jgi:hypothetical protein